MDAVKILINAKTEKKGKLKQNGRKTNLQEDEDGTNSLVKLWQLDRIEKDAPFCIRVIRVCPLLGVGRSTRACAIALHSSLQHIAVGFVDSSVIYCANNIKEK